MERKIIRQKMASKHIRSLSSRHSGRRQDMFSDNRSSGDVLQGHNERIIAQGTAIYDLFQEYHGCDEFFEKLIKILEGDF